MSQRERIERHFPRLSLVSSPVRVRSTVRSTARTRMGEGPIRPPIPIFSIPVVFLVGICRFGIPFLHRKCLSVWNDFPPEAVHLVESSGHLNRMVGKGRMNEKNGERADAKRVPFPRLSPRSGRAAQKPPFFCAVLRRLLHSKDGDKR